MWRWLTIILLVLILNFSCKDERAGGANSYKIFLSDFEYDLLLDCTGKLKNERYLLIIKIGVNSCVSCLSELFKWNDLSKEKNLKVIAVLEEMSLIEDIPLAYEFKFEHVSEDYCMFDFPKYGDIQKILIDMNTKRILFIDFNHTSKTAHKAFQKTIQALMSYP